MDDKGFIHMLTDEQYKDKFGRERPYCKRSA